MELKKEDFDKFATDLNGRIDSIKKDIDKKANPEDVEAKYSDLKDALTEMKEASINKESFGKQQEQLDEIATSIKQLKELQPGKLKTAGQELQEVMNSEEFKKASKKKGSVFNFELKANNITEALTVTDDTTNNTRVIQEEREPGIHRAPRPMLRVWDLINKTATTARVVQYVERTSETDGAQMKGTDGASGGQSDAAWQAKSHAFTSIKAYGKIHRDMLEDFDEVRAELNEILNFDLAAKRNNQILTGTGSSNQLRGLIYSSNPWATSFNAPSTFEGEVAKANYYDVLAIAITQVMQGENTDYRTGFIPTAIVLNPVDARWLTLVKDENGNYMFPYFASAGGTRIENVPVITDPYMTAGTFLVGDFQRARAKIRRGIEIRMHEENEDDALNDLVTLTATHRLGFYVKAQDQYAFVYGTFASAISEIELVTA